MPAQNSHTVCVHLYHLEHSRTATRLPPSPLPSDSHPLADCNSSWKIYVQTHLSKNVYAFCTCWFLSLICPFPLSPNSVSLLLPPPPLPPSSVAFILSFCEHLACSFGFFWPTFGGTRTTKCNEISRVLMT